MDGEDNQIKGPSAKKKKKKKKKLSFFNSNAAEP